MFHFLVYVAKRNNTACDESLVLVTMAIMLMRVDEYPGTMFTYRVFETAGRHRSSRVSGVSKYKVGGSCLATEEGLGSG